MTITLNLTDEQVHHLRLRAARHGHTTIEDYLLSLAEWEPLPAEEWERKVRELHELTKDLPALPDEAFSRETMYDDVRRAGMERG